MPYPQKRHCRLTDTRTTTEIYIDPDTGRSYTWAQTKATALEFGKGLRASWGFQKGDVLGFFSNNTIDFAPAFFGVLWCGGAAMTANPAYTATELAFQLKDSGSKGIVTQVAFLPVATAAAKEAGIPLDRIILMGDGRDQRFRHFTSIRDTKSQPGAAAQRATLDPKKDLAFLVYSSGTTGLPKGVMLTHTNIVANLVQLLDVDYKYNGLHHTGEPDGRGDKQLAILPFFHIYVSFFFPLFFPFFPSKLGRFFPISTRGPGRHLRLANSKPVAHPSTRVSPASPSRVSRWAYRSSSCQSSTSSAPARSFRSTKSHTSACPLPSC